MQKEIILFFYSISNPILDFIANLSSFFGEESILIIILGWVLYNEDKNKGYAIGTNILTSIITTGIIKALVKAPRPFQVLKEIKGKRIETATGYSFPSGHTTGASSLYSSLAIAFKKKKLSIFCATIIVLVGLSRMYLGVHWPLDVFAGLVIGIVLSFILYPIFFNISKDSCKKFKISLILSIVASIFALVLAILLQLNIIDRVAYSDPMKTLALSSGAYLGFALETKKVNYSTEGSLKIKLIRIICLLIGSIIIQGGIKFITPESYYYIGTLIRYPLLGIYLTFFFPIIFKKLFNK